MLRQGGNAADAAVAVAAALNVTEPCSTGMPLMRYHHLLVPNVHPGLGGDAFALFYNAATKQVECAMGNGRTPACLDLQTLHDKENQVGGLSPFHAIFATVCRCCHTMPATWLPPPSHLLFVFLHILCTVSAHSFAPFL